MQTDRWSETSALLKDSDDNTPVDKSGDDLHLYSGDFKYYCLQEGQYKLIDS